MGFIFKVLNFYVSGFRRMTLGRTLWLIILIKVFIMFAVLKLFFFPDILKSRYSTDKERQEHVSEQLTQPIRNK